MVKSIVGSEILENPAKKYLLMEKTKSKNLKHLIFGIIFTSTILKTTYDSFFPIITSSLFGRKQIELNIDYGMGNSFFDNSCTLIDINNNKIDIEYIIETEKPSNILNKIKKNTNIYPCTETIINNGEKLTKTYLPMNK